MVILCLEKIWRIYKQEKNIDFDDRPNGRVGKYAYLFVRIFFFPENQIIKLFGLAKKIEFIYTVKTLYTYGQIFSTRGIRSRISSFFYYYYYFDFWPPYNIYFLSAHPATSAAAGGPQESQNVRKRFFFNPFFISHRVCLCIYVIIFVCWCMVVCLGKLYVFILS